MGILKIPDFAKLGMWADGSAANLPISALSEIVNARCQNGIIERGPVCRAIANITGQARHVISYKDAFQQPRILIAKLDGTISEFNGSGTEANRSVAGYSTVPLEAPITSTILNGVLYVNRADRTPWYLSLSASSSFAKLETYNPGPGVPFSANTRFRALRECGGALVGLSPMINGSMNPNMVMWSNIATEIGLPPKDWDYTSTESSAGQNTLAEMVGEIVDGAKLGTNLMLYSTHEIWVMSPTSNNDMFTFRRMTSSDGIMSANCVVEHAGMHYVFGNNDIYVTDGNTVKSISMGVRDYIFDKSLITTEAHRCFAFHDKAQNSIYFGYVSSDTDCHFRHGAPFNNKGVNRLAVYNLTAQNWSFYDVPYICGMAVGPVATGLTYDDLATTFDETGGSYSSFGDERTCLMMPTEGWSAYSNEVTSTYQSQMLSYEPPVGISPSAIFREATAPVKLAKVLIDLDELKAESYQQKYVSGVYPQLELEAGASPMMFQIGWSLMANDPIQWSDPQPADAVNMKLDFDQCGRYIAIRAVYDDFRQFKLASLSIDIHLLGTRG